MHVWEGKLRMVGPLSRTTGKEATCGKEVRARIVVIGNEDPIVDITEANDAFGQPYWQRIPVGAIDARSVFRALAMTQPNIP